MESRCPSASDDNATSPGSDGENMEASNQYFGKKCRSNSLDLIDAAKHKMSNLLRSAPDATPLARSKASPKSSKRFRRSKSARILVPIELDTDRMDMRSPTKRRRSLIEQHQEYNEHFSRLHREKKQYRKDRDALRSENDRLKKNVNRLKYENYILVKKKENDSRYGAEWKDDFLSRLRSNGTSNDDGDAAKPSKSPRKTKKTRESQTQRRSKSTTSARKWDAREGQIAADTVDGERVTEYDRIETEQQVKTLRAEVARLQNERDVLQNKYDAVIHRSVEIETKYKALSARLEGEKREFVWKTQSGSESDSVEQSRSREVEYQRVLGELKIQIMRNQMDYDALERRRKNEVNRLETKCLRLSEENALAQREISSLKELNAERDQVVEYEQNIESLESRLSAERDRANYWMKEMKALHATDRDMDAMLNRLGYFREISVTKRGSKSLGSAVSPTATPSMEEDEYRTAGADGEFLGDERTINVVRDAIPKLKDDDNACRGKMEQTDSVIDGSR